MKANSDQLSLDFEIQDGMSRITQAAEFGRNLLRERGVSRNIPYGWKGDIVYLWIRGSEDAYKNLPRIAPNGIGLNYMFY